MKRRLLIGLCLVCMLMSLLVFPVSAETSGDCGDNATWSLSGDGVLTISGSGAISDYIYEGWETWPNIKAPWREHASKVKKIVIKSGITRIGKNAFCCLPNVTSVTIPNTVTVIAQAAFADAKKLNNVTIPSSVKTIEKSAFKDCNNLSKIALPSNLTSLGGSAFEGCGNLKSVTLSSNLTKISAWTFAHCYKLTSITIPEGVTEIQNFAFGYSGLTSVKLPKSLEKIAPNAFYACDLKQITIPAKVNQILQNAFADCYSLKRVQFMGNAPSFDSHVFQSITTTAYYPKDNSTWTEAVRKNYGGNVTWIGYCGNGHTWGAWETEREATCAKAGLKTRSCTQCDMKEEESIAKVAHQYNSVVTPPTCKDDGFTMHTCKVCEDSYKDSKTPAGTHAFGEWVIIKEATCLEKGSRQHSCTVCKTKETEEVELSGHTYRDEITAPNCTQEGFTTHICTVCEHTVVDTPTKITEHPFGEWVVVKPASWQEEGEQRRKCADCAEEQIEIIPKLPINWGLIIGVTVAGVVVVAGAVVAIIVFKKKRAGQ